MAAAQESSILRRAGVRHTHQRRRCSSRVQQSQGAARRRQMCPSCPRRCRRSGRFRACCRAHPPRPPEQGRRQQRLGRPPWEWEASCLCAGASRPARRGRSSRWHRGRRRERSRSGWPARPCAAATRAARRVWNAPRTGHSGWGSRPSRSCLSLRPCGRDVAGREVLLAGQSVFVVVTRLQGRKGGLWFAQRTPWWGVGGWSKGDGRICTGPVPSACRMALSRSSHLPLRPQRGGPRGGPYNPAPLGRHGRWKMGVVQHTSPRTGWR